MAKILIAGCGTLGRELGNILAEAGHEVNGLKRHPPEVNYDKFIYLWADITSPTDMDSLGKDYDYVFFIVSPDRRELTSYQNVYELGLTNLLRRLPEAVWLFVSSTSVYAQNQGEWVDEDSEATGDSGTSKLILAAEQKLHAVNPQNIVVRFSGIYGPGREYLLRQARQQPSVQKEPPYFTNRIHQRDCVGVLSFLFNQHLTGVKLLPCYVASDHEPAALWDVMTWLTQQLQTSAPLAKPSGDEADMNKRCLNERLTKLGYRFIYPDFRHGYGEMIQSSKH